MVEPGDPERLVPDNDRRVCTINQVFEVLVGLAELLLGKLAIGDIPDIALDDSGAGIQRIDVADKLNFNLPSIPGFERKIFVPDILTGLQFFKGNFREELVLEESDIPEVFSKEVWRRIPEQDLDERVGIDDLPGLMVQDQDPVLG